MARPRTEIPRLDTRNDVYGVSWYDAETRRTKRISLHTKSFDEAKHRYAAFLTEGSSLMHPASGQKHITVSETLDAYFREYATKLDDRGRTQVAAPERQALAIRHLKKWFKDTPLKEIDVPACNAYVAARRAGVVGGGVTRKDSRAKGSDSTIRRELNVLVAASNHVKKYKRIEASDFPTFDKPRENRGGEEAPWLSEEEISKLVDAANGDLKDFIVIAYWTAARRRSIENLTVRQVNLATNRVNLAKLGELTTKKRRPIVPVFPATREILERRVERAGENGGRIFPPNTDFYKAFVKLTKSLGYEDGRRHPHILRHSRATHMLMADESIYKVAKLLGDTVATVESVYGHHSPEFLNEGGK